MNVRHTALRVAPDRIRRTSCAALLALAALGLLAPAARAAFGVQEKNFEAATCISSTCTYAEPSLAYTQAAGHPPWGITAFEVNANAGDPEGTLKRVRVDVPPGLAADPEALEEKCPIATFEAGECATKHPKSRVGTNLLTAFAEPSGLFLGTTIENEAPVFDLEQPPGLPLDFGIEVAAPPLLNEHIFLEGHVDWSGDYHEYFEIRNITKEVEVPVLKIKARLAVLKSKLIFNGRAGQGNFLTVPSVCSPSTTSELEVESWEGQVSRTQTHTPVGVVGCEKAPFEPAVAVQPETAQSDQPDGTTIEVKVPQHAGAEEINTADIRDARLTLPEGMTLNPSAAHGLEACTAAQIAIGTETPVTCPAGARVGSVAIETDLPAGSLAGNIYLGDPGGGPITGPPYTIYVDAESRYGVSVRLKGLVSPNPMTGRLETTFEESPQLPFSELIAKFNGGPLAPLANPLLCGASAAEALFTPYTGEPAALSASPFLTAMCLSSPPPFAPSQGTSNQPATAGANTSYTFDLGRPDGQQYLQEVGATLPPGLVGRIPSVPLCGEPQAAAGSCASASQIGVATVTAGAGPMPYTFSGPVYLTGPYAGSPYGLSIPVLAAAGPFNLGTIVTRAKIGVGLYSGRVTVSSALPTIVGGVPLRLKSVSVLVNRPSFLLDPTSCGALATDTTLRSTFGATRAVSTPLPVSGCSGLAFKPAFSASSGAHTSKANGASFETRITQGAGQANIRQIAVTLPKLLPSRLTTLQKACPAAMFEAGPPPGSCPSTSRVGSVAVSTPVLPDRLTGPAYLVSQGGGAFPDLDLVLSGDGVEVVLVGHTQITRGITTSTFETLPDVPITSAVVSLPTGPRSLLAANGALCAKTLLAPTTMIAQSGASIKRATKIAITGCPVSVIARRTSGTVAIVRILVPAAGRLSVSGRDLRRAVRHVRGAGSLTLRVPLTRAGIAAMRRSHHLRLRLRVGFQAAAGRSASSASTMLSFRT